MQLVSLHNDFDLLQKKFGDNDLATIYGAGKTKHPKVCFIFMNPTAKNISAHPSWSGLRAPWLGTKNTWKLFTQVGIFPQKLNDEIQSKKPEEWTVDFCEKVYMEVKKNELFISNLAKCTKKDAKPIPNTVFRQYRELMLQEIDLLKPEVIITFGNQVSSILLNKNVQVSQSRKKPFDLVVNTKTYKVFPVYYPVGQGMRNISSSIEDIKFIINSL